MTHPKSCIYIGTSGWAYKGWAESFYPPGLKAEEQLAFYAERFPTVEINATFYRLPTPEAVHEWKAGVPSGFLFAVKGSRAVTHFKKLLPGSKSLPLFMERIPELKSKLGPILWQLPGAFHKNVERLDRFLASLKGFGRMRHAVEFRHSSWFDEEVYDVLRRHHAALVSISTLALPMDLTLTTDFSYIRFHGLEGGAAHDYSREELQPWADHLKACKEKEMRAFAYFNNDANTRAPANAEMLTEMVG